MNHSLTDDFIAFDPNPDLIVLEPDIFQRAKNTSNYRQALALYAFATWLSSRSPAIALDLENCSVFKPEYAAVLDAVTPLQAGDFRVCLLPSPSFSCEEIFIPRVAVELPELAAHFYLAIAVDEDLERAAIRGFLRYDQLTQLPLSQFLQRDWNYAIPLTELNSDSDELLLYLQCLNSTAIPLPEPPATQPAISPQLSRELETRLSPLQNRPLWQGLTWEQGVAVFSHPELLRWRERAQNDPSLAFTADLSDLLKILTQPALNVGRWVQSQTDELLQELSWQFLPPPALRFLGHPSLRDSATMSSPAEDLQQILTRSDLDVPNNAGRAYQDLPFASGLRLYALVWALSYEDSWSLLLIFGAIPGQTFPTGVRLRIADPSGILVEKALEPRENDEYLLTQVVGTYDEKFLVTLTSATQETQTLPPFEFAREPQLH